MDRPTGYSPLQYVPVTAGTVRRPLVTVWSARYATRMGPGNDLDWG